MTLESSLIILSGICSSFALVILLIRRRYNFGFSLLAGALLLALFSLYTNTLYDILSAFLNAIGYSINNNQFTTDTIELAILVILVFMLAKSMQETEAITELTASLRSFFSKGGTLAVIPAIYGLLPIPGGALLSAPLIDEEGKRFSLSKDQKNFLNIWFRHIWFPVYPLSIAMFTLCSSRFSGISITSLMLADTPAFIVSILIGAIVLHYFLRNHNHIDEDKPRYYNGLKYLVIPFLPVIMFFFLQNLGLTKERSFLLSILIDILVLFLLLKISWRKYLRILYRSLTWKPGVAIIGIMVFREIFKISGSDEVISNLLAISSLPPLLLIILVPLILGFLTGYNLAGITLSYFFVQPFFPLVDINLIGVTSLVFMGAFVGYLVSPLHLCNVLSSEYLNTEVTGMYKVFIPSVFSLLIIHVIATILLY